MATSEKTYQTIVDAMADGDAVVAGQMFGKQCLKVNGKAFVALHLETLAFKLREPEHARALALAGAALWDPSGKGRPMKEWVAVPAKARADFMELAKAAREYVGG